MAEDESNGTIRYTVRELLSKIDTRLDEIIRELHRKADADVVRQNMVRIVALEKSADELAIVARYQTGKNADMVNNRRWIVGLVMSTIALVAKDVLSAFRVPGF